MDRISFMMRYQTQTSVSKILNVWLTADSIMYSFYNLCQPPTQRSVSPILTSKFDIIPVRKLDEALLSFLWLSLNTDNFSLYRSDAIY